MFKILLLIRNILNITPEKDLNAPLLPLPPLPPLPPQLLPQSPLSPMISAARSGSGGGRQWPRKQRQWQGDTTINQQMVATATETAFLAAAAATAAAVAAAVATAAIARQRRGCRRWQRQRQHVRSTLRRGGNGGHGGDGGNIGDSGGSRCSRSGDVGCGDSGCGCCCGNSGMMQGRGGQGGSLLSWCDHTLVSREKG